MMHVRISDGLAFYADWVYRVPSAPCRDVHLYRDVHFYGALFVVLEGCDFWPNSAWYALDRL